MTNFNEWSKIGLAFAVGVSLSASYIALGMQQPAAPTVVVEERCDESPQALPAPELAEGPAFTGTPVDYGISQAELEAMASRCELRDDRPAQELTDALAAKLGLNADEREAWDRAIAALGGQHAAMRYTMLAQLAPDFDTSSIDLDAQNAKIAKLALASKLSSDRSVWRNMAKERAGLRKPMKPEHLAWASPWQRWQRWRLASGDRFATLLAKDLGQARVNELRSVFQGWPGEAIEQSGCEDVPLPTSEGPILDQEEALSKDIIARIARAHMSEVLHCYEAGLEDDPALEGKVVVQFVINGEGTVSSATSAEGTDLGHEGVESCVVETLEGWRFPKPRGGGNVIVTYPFQFTPS